MGSSPRVRGSRQQHIRFHSRHGIIPAGAGLTPSSRPCGQSGRDHPRGCGAHDGVAKIVGNMAGSSPRVRGSLQAGSLIRNVTGIIPAGAGLTPSSCIRGDKARDHPRGCGAHCGPERYSARRLGSSPRVRGSRLPILIYSRRPGIIPAGAGLTLVRI